MIKYIKVLMRSAIVFALFASALASSCTGTIRGVSYDLSPLRNDMHDYTTKLYASDDDFNRTLVYNFCRNTIEIPLDVEGGDKCKETLHEVKGGQAITTDKPSPVFLLSKYGNRDSTCTRLALDYTDENNSKMSLYDVTDPAMGVILHYLEGDYCCPYGSNCRDSEYRQKTISFSLRCADAVTTFPEKVAIETNNNECDYTVYYRSVYSCPTECPLIENNVCGKHGVCGYDLHTSKARCYCGDNYKGTTCSEFEYKSLLSVNSLVIFATILLTLIVICTIFYVWNKLRKISVNPDAFENLESKFNELGQMAY